MSEKSRELHALPSTKHSNTGILLYLGRISIAVTLLILATTLSLLIYHGSNYESLKIWLEIVELTLKIAAACIGGMWAIEYFLLSRPDAWSVNLVAAAKITPQTKTHSLMVVMLSITNPSGIRVHLKSLTSTVRIIRIGDLPHLLSRDGKRSSKPVTIGYFGRDSQMPEFVYPTPPKKEGCPIESETIEFNHVGGAFLIEPNTTYIESFFLVVPRNHVIEVLTVALSNQGGDSIDHRLFEFIKPSDANRDVVTESDDFGEGL